MNEPDDKKIAQFIVRTAVSMEKLGVLIGYVALSLVGLFVTYLTYLAIAAHAKMTLILVSLALAMAVYALWENWE